MKHLSLILLAAVLLAVPSHAAWGSGDCGPVGPVMSPVSVPYSQPTAGHRWVRVEGAEELALFYGDTQVGSLRLSDMAYFARTGPGQFEGPTDCPAPMPENPCRCPDGCGCPADNCTCPHAPTMPPCGVEADKVRPGRHCVNGRDCGKKEVMEAIAKASIPADQGKLRLTLIGPSEQTGQVAKDVAALPEAGTFLVKEYTPDHWAVKDTGLAAGRPFSICVQTPDGGVLHRQWDYEGGVNALAEALRNASAGYDASHDPDLRKGDPFQALIKELQKVPVEVWVVGVGVLLFFSMRKGK